MRGCEGMKLSKILEIAFIQHTTKAGHCRLSFSRNSLISDYHYDLRDSFVTGLCRYRYFRKEEGKMSERLALVK